MGERGKSIMAWGDASLSVSFCIVLTLGRISMFLVPNHIKSLMKFNTQYPFALLWLVMAWFSLGKHSSHLLGPQVFQVGKSWDTFLFIALLWP